MYGYNNPLVFTASVAFFMIFLNAKPITHEKTAKVISFIASHTFAVYQLHSNNPLLSRWRAFLIDLFGQNLLFAKYLVLLPNALIIMAVCILIDIAYDFIFKKPADKLGISVEKAITFIYAKIQLFIYRIFAEKSA